MKSAKPALAVILALAVLFTALPAAARLLPVWVTKVTDGDTYHGLLDGKKITVRLPAVDTPEMKGYRKGLPAQPGAHEAKAFVVNLIADQYVLIEYQGEITFGRVVAPTLTHKGLDVGRELVRAGWAWVDERFNKDPTLTKLMNEAREAKRGLWGLPGPHIAPKDWRKGAGKK
jgi:endonuclease YncB( thermonuclease family)